MDTRVAEETDLIELLVCLIAGRENGDPPTPRTGKELTCSQPTLGQWIADCDYVFLMETLALPDNVFGQEFPRIRLSQADRVAFANKLKIHCRECAPCHVKQQEDLELKARLEEAFAENKHILGALLGKP